MIAFLPLLRTVPDSRFQEERELDHEVRIHAAAEGAAILAAVRTAMSAAGFSQREQFAVELSLDEAIANALKHGNRGDRRKHVLIQWQVSRDRVLVAVEDQGPGFDPDGVADPCDSEGLLRPSGRGVFLMRHYLSWVRYNERGNRVLLCKVRSA